MLRDKDEAVRRRAAKELGKLGPDARAALPVLTKLKLDPDLQVREAATTAIELIKQ
jgi:HEAT repeat protein